MMHLVMYLHHKRPLDARQYIQKYVENQFITQQFHEILYLDLTYLDDTTQPTQLEIRADVVKVVLASRARGRHSGISYQAQAKLARAAAGASGLCTPNGARGLHPPFHDCSKTFTEN